MYLDAARPGLRGRPRERRRHRAGDAVVPRRRRDRVVLRPVHPDRQPGADRGRRCRADYLLTERAGRSRATYTVGANSRFNIWVDLEDAGAGRRGTVHASSRRPTACRSSSSARCGGRARRRHLARSAQQPGRDGDRHALGAGRGRSRRAARARETYVLIANTSAVRRHGPRDAAVRGRHARRRRCSRCRPNSRTNVGVRRRVPGGARQRASARSSRASARRRPQIVVERAMYSNANGVVWAAGTNALATRLP